MMVSGGTFFSGLIRARGDETGGNTTEGTTYVTTWEVTDIFETTIPPLETTIIPDSTEVTTIVSTDVTSTIDVTAGPPSKPKKHSYFLTLWVKGQDANGDPTFTTNEADARVFTDTTQPGANPSVTGAPTDDAGVGTLKAAGIAMGDAGGTWINTNETGTKGLDAAISPNPKFTWSIPVSAPGATSTYKKKVDVQVWYHWKYPSSP